LNRYVMIAIGGAVGSILRYQVALMVQSRVPAGFPYGTFVVNMSACVIMGFVMTLLTEHLTGNPAWRFLIPIGFIGAYSTFSTWEYETFIAASEGARYVALANVAGSFVGGYIALWFGVVLAKLIF
jgi:CrcB protein